MPLLTRAEYRDSVRRKLNIVPPKDAIPGAMAGQQPTNYPLPTNAQINEAFTDAIADANRISGFHVTGFRIPVAADTSGSRQPFGMYLGNLTPNTAVPVTPEGWINDVQRVLWIPDSSGIPVLLLPNTRDNLDRGRNVAYYNQPPQATPYQYYIEDYTLYVTPAQNESGTYFITAGTAVVGLQCDNDILDQVPIDYQNIFEYGAIYHLSIGATQDIEWKDRAAAFGPLFQAGILRFKEFKLGGTGAPRATLNFLSYRGGYGVRRVVR